jgi:hypothetical protein
LHNYSASADLLEQLTKTMDENDPRFTEVLFQAGIDYEKAGSRNKAREFYDRVAEKGSGPLKDRASVASAALQ